MLRVVLDTNQFVSSVLVPRGLPAQVIDAWRQREYLLVISPEIIAEIRATLDYPRIRRKYLITDEQVERLIAVLEQDALVVSGEVNTSGAIPDDPDDDKILACAVDGMVDLIVSGDRHLLALGEYKVISIITAREFLERLRSEP
jgi:putative PIN family toxin of toxin-antitoxin system